eukprot:CAMPEP_0202978804 /NCGR_PEP_ID=MMETSP1396-20130829/85122_1 /ASSEMBLY_ACC=CAM_ASM_000872 /TAXON_ID= /ORGANISM="Pseudokeronopsis sp., Strain Brazil" /LENGTH=39 /DNA_ID= /DNA_START= /DNA_END= /DNA_ORIENTATION=
MIVAALEVLNDVIVVVGVTNVAALEVVFLPVVALLGNWG